MAKLLTKKRIFIFPLYVLLAIVVFCFFDIYFWGYRTDLSKFTTKIIPYPALMVNNNIVSIKKYEDFSKNYQLYLKEFEQREDRVNSKLALKTLIQKLALKQIVSQLDIGIKEEEFNEYAQKFYENNAIQVDKKKFNDYFLRLLFYRDKILEKISDDDFNLENKKKIELIYGELLKDPDKFSEYSEIYKDVNFGIDGSLLGWLSLKELPESLGIKVNKMEVGDFTNIIKSLSGYHIYKLNGKIEKDDNNYYYQFEQIFLPIENFNNYLNSFLENSKIFYFLKTTS